MEKPLLPHIAAEYINNVKRCTVTAHSISDGMLTKNKIARKGELTLNSFT